jgi:biopolymer transport protein ExbD
MLGSPAVQTLRSLLLAPLLLLLAACGGSDRPEGEVEEIPPAVRPVQLPVSIYSVAEEPSGAIRIDMSRTEMQVDGERVFEMRRGAVPDDALDGDLITPLADALRSGPARTRGAVTCANNVPYETLSRVLLTLEQARVRDVHFAVRTADPVPEVRWLPVSGFGVWARDAELAFEGEMLPWDTVVAGWRPLFETCRAGNYVNCDAARSEVMTGGGVYVRLYTSGQAVRYSFIRTPPEGGDPEDPEAEAEAEAEAIPEPDEELGLTAGVPYLGPARRADFTFRLREAGSSESKLTELSRAHCAARSCDVLVEADGSSPAGQVISLVAAAFPEGISRPELRFRLPVRQ